MAFPDLSLLGNITNINGSNTESSSQDYFGERTVPLILNCALNAPLSLVAMLGNAAVVYSIWSNPSLHFPSNIILVGLAICDFGVGMVVQPLYIIYQSFYLTNRLQTWLAAMEVFNIISNLFCGVSFVTTTAVSIDRFLAVHLHLRYREFVTARRTIILLGILWFVSGCVASTLIWNKNITFFTVVSVIAVCLFITFSVYVKIFSVVRRHQRRIQGQQIQSTRSLENSRSTMGMFYICIIHFLCYLLYFVCLILRDLYKKNLFTILATEFAQTFIFLNSSLNPIIYCWRLQEIRSVVKRSFASLGCNYLEDIEASRARVITD